MQNERRKITRYWRGVEPRLRLLPGGIEKNILSETGWRH